MGKDQHESNLPSWVEKGDILIIQKPFKDETIEDYNNLPDIDSMVLNHIALVTSTTSSHCVSHSVTEGYNFPSCRNTKLWNGTYLVIRCEDNTLALNAVSICRKWCSGVEVINKDTYLQLYDHHRWDSRKPTDLDRFSYSDLAATQLNIYAEPRATDDLRLVYNDPTLKCMSPKSVVRAVKFSTRRDITKCKVSKGFRCTPLLVASWQAAILSPIVTPTTTKVNFKSITSLEGALSYLNDGWKETREGKLLQDGDFEELFLDGAFAVDCRYVVPKDIYERLIFSSKFSTIGMFSYYNKSIPAEQIFTGN